jgi:hypothetical protein
LGPVITRKRNNANDPDVMPKDPINTANVSLLEARVDTLYK